jgi:hypothetical protein
MPQIKHTPSVSRFVEPETGLFGEPVERSVRVLGDAVFDGPGDCYRTLLTRTWDPDRPRVCFVMLNPSTADANTNDPTVAKDIRLARAWGFGGLDVVNMFAWRATDPAELLNVPDPVGPNNAATIIANASGRTVVCAWGRIDPRLYERHAAHVERVINTLVGLTAVAPDTQLRALGYTKDGSPRHPLYMREDTVLLPFPATPAEAAASAGRRMRPNRPRPKTGTRGRQPAGRRLTAPGLNWGTSLTPASRWTLSKWKLIYWPALPGSRRNKCGPGWRPQRSRN